MNSKLKKIVIYLSIGFVFLFVFSALSIYESVNSGNQMVWIGVKFKAITILKIIR